MSFGKKKLKKNNNTHFLRVAGVKQKVALELFAYPIL